MWAFEKFPAKIEHRLDPDREDLFTTQVEVFGYFGSPQEQSCQLIAFRVTTFGVQEYIGDVNFLPVDEFEKQFAGFTLIQENKP